MPGQVLKSFGLYRNNGIYKKIEQHETMYFVTITAFFADLDGQLAFSVSFKDEYERLKHAAMLFKYAAILNSSPPKISSWAVELWHWGKKTGRTTQVTRLLKEELKLTHLIPDFFARDSLTLANEKEAVPNTGEVLASSFRNYVIDESLKYFEGEYGPHRDVITDLKGEFAINDLWRRDFLFFLYAMNVLFLKHTISEEHKLQLPIEAWANIVYPPSKHSSYVRGCQILENLAGIYARDEENLPLASVQKFCNSTTYQVMRTFLGCLSAEQLTNFKMCEAQKKELFALLYQADSRNHEGPQFEKKLHQTRLFILKLGGSHYLGKRCTETLFQQIQAFADSEQQGVVQGIHRIFSFCFPSDEFIKNISSLFKRLSMRFVFAKKAPVPFTENLHIIEQWLESPVYDLLHVFFTLCEFHKHMHAKAVNAQLLDWIQQASQLEREQAVNELRLYVKKAAEVFSTTPHKSLNGLRRTFLAKSYQNWIDTHPHAAFSDRLKEVLSDWPKQLSVLEKYQLQVLTTFKELIEKPLPLSTVITVLWHGNYVPQTSKESDILEILKESVRLKKEVFLNGSHQAGQNFSLLSSFLNNLNTLIRIFSSNELYITSDNVQVIQHLEFLYNQLHTTFLPKVTNFLVTFFDQEAGLDVVLENVLSDRRSREILELGTPYLGDAHTNLFFQQINSFSSEEQRGVILGIHRILSFCFPNNEFKQNTNTLFKRLSVRFFIGASQEATSSFTEDLKIIEDWKETPLYNFLHVFFTLCEFHKHIGPIEKNIHKELLERIQKATKQDREHAVRELRIFAKKAVEASSSNSLNHSIIELRKAYLLSSYQKWTETYRDAALCGRLKEIIADWPRQLPAIENYQFEVIRVFEELIRSTVPLSTLFTVFWLGVYIPQEKDEVNIIKIMKQAVALREKIYDDTIQRKLSFAFVLPSLVNAVNGIMSIYNDSEYCMAQYDSRVAQHLEALYNQLHVTILPTLTIREVVCQQAIQFFLKHKKPKDIFFPYPDILPDKKLPAEHQVDLSSSWRSSNYKIMWRIEKTSSGHFPCLEVVFKGPASLENKPSHTLSVILEVPIEQFNANMIEVLKVDLEALEKDAVDDEEYDRQVRELDTPLEAFEFYKQTSADSTTVLVNCLAKYAEEEMASGELQCLDALVKFFEKKSINRTDVGADHVETLTEISIEVLKDNIFTQETRLISESLLGKLFEYRKEGRDFTELVEITVDVRKGNRYTVETKLIPRWIVEEFDELRLKIFHFIMQLKTQFRLKQLSFFIKNKTD